MRTSRHGGEPRLAARLRDALADAESTHGRSLVILRLLLPRTAQSLDPDERAGALLALVRRVRRHVRSEDAVVVDPLEGLGVIVGSACPDAARIVAERLRDVLAPLRAEMPRNARSRRAPHASGAVSPGQPAPLLRIGLGYAAPADGEPPSCDMLIGAAWKPRMLLSLSPPAMSADTTDLADVADAGRTAPPSGVGEEAATVRDTRGPEREEEPAEGPTMTGATGAIGTRHLRLVRRDAREAAHEQESEALRELAHALGVPFVRLPSRLPASARRAFSPALARELRAVAIGRTRDTLTVAMNDPCDSIAVLRLRSTTGLAIFPVLALAEEIERALGQLG